MTETRKYIDFDDECDGLTIESIHKRTECVLILFADSFAIMEAEGDDEGAYLSAPGYLRVGWFIASGFDLEFIRKHRLLPENRIVEYEIEEAKAKQRQLAAERARYERLKAKFEGPTS